MTYTSDSGMGIRMVRDNVALSISLVIRLHVYI